MFPYRFPTALITSLALAQPQMVFAQDIVNIAKNITVKITGYGNGSGVIFAKEENIYSVVTNQHVVPIDTDYEIRTNDGRKHQVISRQEISGFDLAIIKFESEQSYQIATMGDSDNINALQKIYVAGFPGETIDIDITDGTIRSIRQEVIQNPKKEKGYALIYTNQTISGSSGGAVLDEQGRLIGINGDTDPDIKTGRDISRGIPINLFLAEKKPIFPNNQQPATPEIIIDNINPKKPQEPIFNNPVTSIPNKLPLTNNQPILISKATDINYSRLQGLLKANKWKEADQETTRMMLQAAGRQREGRFRAEDLNKFFCEDLRIIDQLWLDNSQGKFGFSVQQKIWQRNGSPSSNSSIEVWRKFYIDVGWKIQESGLASSEGYVKYDELMGFHNIDIAKQGNLPKVWNLLQINNAKEVKQNLIKVREIRGNVFIHNARFLSRTANCIS